MFVLAATTYGRGEKEGSEVVVSFHSRHCESSEPSQGLKQAPETSQGPVLAHLIMHWMCHPHTRSFSRVHWLLRSRIETTTSRSRAKRSGCGQLSGARLPTHKCVRRSVSVTEIQGKRQKKRAGISRSFFDLPPPPPSGLNQPSQALLGRRSDVLERLSRPFESRRTRTASTPPCPRCTSPSPASRT